VYWFCDKCPAWGEAATEVDVFVDRKKHMDDKHGPNPAGEEEPEHEDRLISAQYLAWGATALVGLLSTHWTVLVGVIPFIALVAFVLTFQDH
jgi:hypothetical protein